MHERNRWGGLATTVLALTVTTATAGGCTGVVDGNRNQATPTSIESPPRTSISIFISVPKGRLPEPRQFSPAQSVHSLLAGWWLP